MYSANHGTGLNVQKGTFRPKALIPFVYLINMQEQHISALQVDFNNNIILLFTPIQNKRHNYSFVCCELQQSRCNLL
jgi:hypothetical protein